MQKTIDAIYEDGVFKPVKKVSMAEHTRLKLVLLEEKENVGRMAKKQSGALISLAGIGASGLKDVSENPERYLYGSK